MLQFLRLHYYRHRCPSPHRRVLPHPNHHRRTEAETDHFAARIRRTGDLFPSVHLIHSCAWWEARDQLIFGWHDCGEGLLTFEPLHLAYAFATWIDNVNIACRKQIGGFTCGESAFVSSTTSSDRKFCSAKSPSSLSVP